MFVYLFSLPVTIWLSHRAYRLFANYRTACTFGLPIILLPVSFEEPWWMLLRPLFPWVEHLPFGLGNWYLYTTMGWPTEDGTRTTKLLGENFVLCSPVSNMISTCYPPAIQKIYGEHKNWPQPSVQSQLFTFYGQNVSSTNGVEWQRHRKITSSAFNEVTLREVWEETIARVEEIDFKGENERSLARIRSTFDVLAMQVLANVGFGQDMSLTTVPPGHRESLMDSLGFMLKHIMLTVIFNGLKAPDYLLPTKLRKLKVSVTELRLYMEEAILKHMQTNKEGSDRSQKSSLLGAMVKANEAEKEQLQKGNGRPSYLTESELYGNLFVFNVAGYETTASSLTFAFAYLAAYPETQDWIFEELQQHYIGRSDDAKYDTVYPRLVRCLSVMYETLRFASPAPLLVRSPIEPSELPIMTTAGPSSINVSPGTVVGGHFYGGHLSPRWGLDAENFDPRRFVSYSASGEEALIVPEGPMYAPWIFGSRVCPGKKFSQVEFVALIAQILSKWRIQVAVTGQSFEVARDGLLKMLSDEKYFNISTHLLHPEAAGVKFVKR
jgi:cytochrome P450